MIVRIDKNPPVDACIQAGIIPIFSDLLDLNRYTSKIHYEVAWCIINIACEGPIQCKQILLQTYNILYKLLQILSYTTDEGLKAQILWAISNLTVDSDISYDVYTSSPLLDCILSYTDIYTVSLSTGTGEKVGVYTKEGSVVNLSPAVMRHIQSLCANFLR